MEEPMTYTARICPKRPFKQVNVLNPASQLAIHGQEIDVIIRDVHDTVVMSY